MRPARKGTLFDEMRADCQGSIRRAHAVIRFDLRTYCYTSRRSGKAVLEQRIREICQIRARFGYRRVHVLLTGEGWEISAKKTCRIYRELGMQFRKKTPKRRVTAKLREDCAEATNLNDVRAMNLVHDQWATGRKATVLTVVNAYSRFVPVLFARFSHRGEEGVRTLDRVCRRTSNPEAIRKDQGSDFISRDMDLWAYQRGVSLDFSRPGKPTDNPFIEAFKGRFLAECLYSHWFISLEDAVEKLEN